MEGSKLGSFTCPQCGGAVDVLEGADGQPQMDYRDCEHFGSIETTTREQVEEQYYKACASVDALVRKLEPQQVVNLLQQMLVGTFDVGILEGLSEAQAKGVTLWLNDLVITSEHLDLSKGAAAGEWVAYQ